MPGDLLCLLELFSESSMSVIALELSESSPPFSLSESDELGDIEVAADEDVVRVVNLEDCSSHSFRRTNEAQFCLMVIALPSLLNKYLCKLASNLMLTF
jgi:hypothetical protein